MRARRGFVVAGAAVLLLWALPLVAQIVIKDIPESYRFRRDPSLYVHGAIENDSPTYPTAAPGQVYVKDKMYVTGQVTSTVATGTAPFSVSSTTKVTNLNADQCDDVDCATALSSTGEPFVTVSNTATLTAERALSAGTYTTVTDNGANASIAVNCQDASGAVGGCLSTGVQTLAGAKTWGGAATFSDNVDARTEIVNNTQAAGSCTADRVCVDDAAEINGLLLVDGSITGNSTLAISGDADINGSIFNTGVGACGSGPAGALCLDDVTGTTITAALGVEGSISNATSTVCNGVTGPVCVGDDLAATGDIYATSVSADYFDNYLSTNACGGAAGAACITDSQGVEFAGGVARFLYTASADDVDVDGDLNVDGTLDQNGASDFAADIVLSGAADISATGTGTSCAAGNACVNDTLEVNTGIVNDGTLDQNSTSDFAVDIVLSGTADISATGTGSSCAASSICLNDVTEINFALQADGNVTVGTTSAGSTVTINSATTGSIQNLLKLQHTDTDTTGGTNQGVQIQMLLEDSASALNEAGTMRAQWRTATNLSEDGQLVFETTSNGVTGVDVLTIDGDANPNVLLSLATQPMLRVESTGTAAPIISWNRTAGTVDEWQAYMPSGSNQLRFWNSGEVLTLQQGTNAGTGLVGIGSEGSGGIITMDVTTTAATPNAGYVKFLFQEINCGGGAGNDCALRFIDSDGNAVNVACDNADNGC